MNLGEMKTRRDVIDERVCVIGQVLAEGKRRWLAERVEGPTGQRAALQAERAELCLERNRLCAALHAAQTAENLIRQHSFTATLVGLLQDRGHAELVVEAERLHLDRMMAIAVVPQ